MAVSFGSATWAGNRFPPFGCVAGQSAIPVLGLPRGSKAATLTRIVEFIGPMRQTYPAALCELNFPSPVCLLIPAVLSAQRTDQPANVVTADRFRRFRSAATLAVAAPGWLATEFLA